MSLSINPVNQTISFTGVTNSESLPISIPSPVFKSDREEDPGVKKSYNEKGWIATFQKDFTLLRSTYLYGIIPSIWRQTNSEICMYYLLVIKILFILLPTSVGNPDSSDASSISCFNLFALSRYQLMQLSRYPCQ